LPLTASTALPTQSMLMPYSQRSPGSDASGMVSALFSQVVMPGMPARSMYCPIAAFQML
jgi:hypothetical protein